MYIYIYIYIYMYIYVLNTALILIMLGLFLYDGLVCYHLTSIETRYVRIGIKLLEVILSRGSETCRRRCCCYCCVCYWLCY